MELFLRVRGSNDRVVDVIAVVDTAHTVSELTAALCEYLDESGEGVVLESANLGEHRVRPRGSPSRV